MFVGCMCDLRLRVGLVCNVLRMHIGLLCILWMLVGLVCAWRMIVSFEDVCWTCVCLEDDCVL